MTLDTEKIKILQIIKQKQNPIFCDIYGVRYLILELVKLKLVKMTFNVFTRPDTYHLTNKGELFLKMIERNTNGKDI